MQYVSFLGSAVPTALHVGVGLTLHGSGTLADPFVLSATGGGGGATYLQSFDAGGGLVSPYIFTSTSYANPTTASITSTLGSGSGTLLSIQAYVVHSGAVSETLFCGWQIANNTTSTIVYFPTDGQGSVSTSFPGAGNIWDGSNVGEWLASSLGSPGDSITITPQFRLTAGTVSLAYIRIGAVFF